MLPSARIVTFVRKENQDEDSVSTNEISISINEAFIPKDENFNPSFHPQVEKYSSARRQVFMSMEETLCPDKPIHSYIRNKNMGTRYVMKEMPDLQDTGKTVTYPQMVMTGQTGTRQLAEYIAKGTGFAKGITEGVICELSEAIAHEMGMGRSVKIEGLGVFTPSLALHVGKEREGTDENAQKRNAQSLHVGSVNFRADKRLIQETNNWCNLERAPWKPARSSRKYTPEQRLALAQAYLEENPYLSVQDYRRLTGLLQTSATTELRRWALQPDSGIDTSGRGSHRVYIKRKESPTP